MGKTRFRILITIGVIALLGIANAGYLAYIAFEGVAPTCTIIKGCELVAASPYARVFGIPLALFGVLFYTLVLGTALWGFLAAPRSRVARFILPLTALGFLLSLYFLYLQAFVIHAFCQYCLFSLLDATILFSLAFWLFRAERGALSRPASDSSGAPEGESV